MSTLMLIDGNSLTYRAFFALPPEMATASGQLTNAVFGFTSMLINLVRDHEPDSIIVAFDRPEPTFRHKMVDTYKANRDKTPDTLYEQMDLVKQVIDSIGIRRVELAGFEADDLIATLATRADSEGIDVLVVTGDRDSYQLVSDPHIRVVYNKRGVSDYALYDEVGIEERTGVRPDLYVQYAALRGDNSDNLPGVPGVGEKTAAKLINKYGGLDAIFADADAQTPKLSENLKANEERARSNVEMMELVRDVTLDDRFNNLVVGYDPDLEAINEVFSFLEFHSMASRFVESFGIEIDGAKPPEPLEELLVEVVTGLTPRDLVERIESSTSKAMGLGFAGGYDGTYLSGLALVLDETSGQVAWFDLEAVLAPDFASALCGLGDDLGLIGHGMKATLRALLGHGVDLTGELMADTAVGEYLLNPAGGGYELVDLLAKYTGQSIQGDDSAPSGQLDFGEDKAAPSLVAAQEALAALRTWGPMSEALSDSGLTNLNQNIEVPLIGVLARMEHVGIGVDRPGLVKLSDDMTAEAGQLSIEIQKLAGYEFNVNSTKALQKVLFDELGLKPQKKTKTGYSTNQATLEKLLGDHEIIDLLLLYREVEKLRSTYGKSLIASVEDDSRIHATFNQLVARTGRLSSENPNLHNIPVRTELGRSFRTVFVATEPGTLLIADYNQIELRCIAHLANDPGLIEAFNSGIDVHSAVAGQVFGVDVDEVTFEQRSKAKMVSYGLAYGMEAFGLGQRLGIATSEAGEILKSYFDGFPAVQDYMDSVVDEAKRLGYTETLFGRRRAIPELASSTHRVRQAGERQAMNAGIQGLAADIFKVALVRLDNRIAAEGLESVVVLQVHDEVILDVPPGEEDIAKSIVTEELMGAFEMAVPLEVNLSFGKTWADAKG